MESAALWFDTYNARYTGNEPAFFPVAEIDVAKELENNYEAIRSELEQLWQPGSGLMEKHGNFDAYDDKQFPPNSWKKIVFKVWGIKNKAICSRFPFTTALIEKYPAITGCFVTRTSAHSIIKPHSGETNAHYRIHLGLHVPEVDSSICGMEVLNETVTWKNGKTFAFLDAQYHHVWNNSDSDRYVLIVDLLRPQFAARKNFICTRVIVSQLFYLVANKLNSKAMVKTPGWVLNALAYLLVLPVAIAMFFNNRFGLVKL